MRFSRIVGMLLGLAVMFVPSVASAEYLSSVLYDIPTPSGDLTISPNYMLPKSDGSLVFTSAGANSSTSQYSNRTKRINVLKPDGSVNYLYATNDYNINFAQLANFGNKTCVTETVGIASIGNTQSTFINHDLISGGYRPPYLYRVATGSDGSCWFTMGTAGKIGKIALDGVVTHYTVGSYASENPGDITLGPDDAMWFTESGARDIAKFNTSTGAITRYQLPNPSLMPLQLISDNNNGLWFIESGQTSKIAHISVDGSVVDYTLPAPYASSLSTITADNSGSVWFTTAYIDHKGKIGRITLDGQVNIFDIDSNLAPQVIRYGNDGVIWATLAGPSSSLPQFAKIFITPHPVTLASSGDEASAPALNWNAVQGATAYNVYRNGVKISTVSATNFTDQNSSEGTYSYYVTSENTSGESQPSNSVQVLVDKTSPVIVANFSRQPNGQGWYGSNVVVSFDCSDPDGDSSASGVATCTSPTNVTQEGEITVTGTVTDGAGNSATAVVVVMIDTTAPTITFTAESNSWTNGASVQYQCVDGGNTTTNTAPIVTNPDGTSSATGTCTDSAGNTTSQTLPVHVDTSAPQTNYSTSSPTMNELGWSRDPVTVTFACSDPGGDQASGIASCSDPVTVTQEGTTVVTGTAVDNAGNSTQVNVFVNIDSIDPDITANIAQTPNAEGWYGEDVTVSFTCSDETSGVAVCPQPIVVSAEGVQTVSGTAVDVAGNTKTVDVTVKIDKSAPTIDFTLNPTPNANSWNNGATTVTFNCQDATLVSCTEPVTVSAEGTTVVTGTAVDAAGNTTEVNAFVNIDSVDPEITAEVAPAPNAAGWYGADTTVTFICTDATSGVASCTDPVTVTADGTHSVTGTVTDAAGNSQSIDVPVNLDKTNPTIDYTLSPVPNAQGWNKDAVVVNFACADETSGVATCSDPITIDTEGVTAVTGNVIDNAGNSNEVMVFVSVDKTDPTLSANFSSANAQVAGWYTADVTAAFACDDALSGILSCTSSHPDAITADGIYTVTGTATDIAENTLVVTETVKLDKTAPVLAMPSWTANPMTVGATTDVSVPAVDGTSGIAAAEYFVGDTDPGVGNATAMAITNQWVDANGAVTSANLTATLGTGLQTGTYKVTVRAKDSAGNWSVATLNYLVVFDATGPTDVTASKKSVPKLANGDALPGLLNDQQNGQASLAFDVSFVAGTNSVDSLSSLTLDYMNKQGCKKLKAGCVVTNFTSSTTTPEAISSLTINGQNSSVGTFQGVGTLTVDTEQGTAVTMNPFKVQTMDGGRTTPLQSDNAVLYIYATGANTSTATPLYQFGLSANGNWVKIQ